MQWIKTLIMFLAFFLGGDALCAQPQSTFIAKHRTAPIKLDTSSFLNCTGTILTARSNNIQSVIHKIAIPKTGKKIKYRCGSKRFKNFALPQVNVPLHIRAQRTIGLTHRHTKYCCGRYCCGKKSWRQRAVETKALLTSSRDKTYPELFPDNVLKERHKSLSVIAPRE